ncbi:MAG: sigma-54-dependent Fis family transcriptional regulator, partial [Gemmatimonadetes bacterium]|nr:sigma-54-dependent Fis family transcriptional regulator [Gemmatimonadota bacterium]
MSADPLLIIEDEALFREELARHFRREGWEVALAEDVARARAILESGALDPLVVLSDLSLPDGSGLDLLEERRSRGDTAEWVFLTGYGTVPDSVRALRLGAHDFLQKPVPLERLDLVVHGAARGARAQRSLRERAGAGQRRYTPDAFLGGSAAARDTRALLSRLASIHVHTLLIEGETGTGKGLAARILHHSGHRADGPLVEVNCAALPSELLESELFGHEPGAFTGAKGRHRGFFEQASGGTLFLDEIGETTLQLQAKLLKAVEDRRIRRVGSERETDVDVQVFAASNRDLRARVAEGTFREDLYHRLSVLRIELPPLRERMEDLPDLVWAAVAEFNAAIPTPVKIIPDRVWERLRAYGWPGNVRELRNVVERSGLLSTTAGLTDEWLNLPSGAEAPRADDPDAVVLPLDGHMSFDEM